MIVALPELFSYLVFYVAYKYRSIIEDECSMKCWGSLID